MAISASFTADFSSFQKAVQEAEAKLRPFEDNANKVAASLTRMGNSFSGTKIISEATLMAKAVADAGGASTLTAREMERVNSTVNEAIAKYRALGGTAPQSMLALADATKTTQTSTEKFIGGLSTVNGLLGGLGIGLSVGALVGFGKALLNDADALVKMSDKTGISIQWLQKFQVAGDDAGNTAEEIAAAVNMMQKRFDDASFKTALSQLGIAFENIRNLSPEAQFVKLAEAVAQIKDPVLQAQLATDLFGKAGVTVLPVIKRGFDDVKDAAVGMSEDTVRNMDAVGDAISRMWRSFKGFIADVLVNTLHPDLFGMRAAAAALDEAGKAADRARPKIAQVMPHSVVVDVKEFDRAMEGSTKTIEANASRLRSHSDALAAVNKKLQDAKRDVGNLTAAQQESVTQYKALGLSNDEVALKMGVSVVAVQRLEEGSRKTAAAIGTVKESVEKLLPSQNTWSLGIGQLNQRIPDLTQHAIEAAAAIRELDTWVAPLADRDFPALNKQIATLPPVVAGATAAIDEATTAVMETGAATNTLGGQLDALAATFTQIAQVSDGAMGDVARSIGEVVVAMKLAKESGEQFRGAISSIKAGNTSGGYVQLAGSIAGTVAALDAATASGGTAERALKGAAAGAAAGTAIMPGFGTAVGAGVGALVGWYRGAKAAREETEKWRKVTLDFERQIWSTLTATQAAEAQNKPWAATTIAVRDAYLATGRSAADAERDVAAMWAATSEGGPAAQAAIDLVNQAFIDLKAHTEAVDAATQGFMKTVEEVGIGIPDFLQPMIDDLLAMPGITDDVKSAITGLRDSATPDFAKLEAMAKTYGGTIDQLGPKFKQAHTTADAQKWITDIEKLVAAGADYNEVLGFMQDEAQAIVTQSRQFGTTIPENMKGYLQSLIDSGQLLDENKEIITDISVLRFGPAVKTDVDKLKDSIDLLAKVIGEIPGKLADINKVRVNPIHVPIIYDDPGFSGGSSSDGRAAVGAFARGTVVPFVPRISATSAARVSSVASSSRDSVVTATLVSAVNGMRSDMARDRVFIKESTQKAFKAALQKIVA